jgi:hypothetical protein
MRKLFAIVAVLLIAIPVQASQGGIVLIGDRDPGPHPFADGISLDVVWSLPATGSILATTDIEYRNGHGWAYGGSSLSIMIGAHGVAEIDSFLMTVDRPTLARARTTFHYMNSRTGRQETASSEFLIFIVTP